MNSEKLNPHVEAVMKLLLQEGVGAASRYVEANISPEVARARQELEAKVQEESAVKNIIAMAQTGVNSKSVSGVADDADGAPDNRSQIIAVAAEVARRGDGTATLEAVLGELERRGIHLKSSRPGTTVGNILHKSPEWEMIEPRVYRLVLRGPSSAPRRRLRFGDKE